MTMTRRLAIVTALLASSAAWTLPASALETTEDIVRCANGNVPQRSFSQMLGISAFDRAGVERRLVAQLYGQRVSTQALHLMIGISRPEDLAGARYLIRSAQPEDEMYMYLPALDSVRQIRGEAARSKLWGTDFSYPDIKQIFGAFTYGDIQRKDDTTTGERPVYVLSVTPSADSPYTRIETHIDQRTCLTKQVEFYATGGNAIKRLTLNPDAVSKEDGRFVGHEYHMRDLQEGTHTVLYLGDVIYDEAVPEDAFSPRSFRYVD